MSSGILVYGYGNPGRLDDGLGPALAAMLEKRNQPGITVDSNYQLSVEDAELVSRHKAVVFLDASVNGPEPFGVEKVVPDGNCSFSTHSVSPAQVMGLAEELFDSKAEAFIVGIRGYDTMSLVNGCQKKQQIISNRRLSFWTGFCPQGI